MKDTPDLTTHSVEFKPKEKTPIDPAAWVAEANAVRQSLAADGLSSDQMVAALNGFRFLDDGGQSWTYNGSVWMTWNGAAWVGGSPPAALHLQPFKLEWMGDMPPAPMSATHSAKTPVPAPPAPPHLEATEAAVSTPPAPPHAAASPKQSGSAGHIPPPPPPKR